MPLPLVGWAVAAGAAKAAAAFGTYKYINKKAHEKGYHEGRQEAQAYINQLTSKLSQLQQQRESVKEQFQSIIQDMSNLDVNDQGFFAKTAAFIKGYTHFHIYVVGVISIARYRSMELSLPDGLNEELKNIVLGFIEGGFPENLKRDIQEVWQSTDADFVSGKITYCQKRIPDHLSRNFYDATKDVDDAVIGLYELHNEERKIEMEIEQLRKAV